MQDPEGIGGSAVPVISTPPEGGRSNLEGSEGVESGAWPVPEPASACVRSWKVIACDCDARAYESGCCRLSCRTCEHHLRGRRAGAIRDRIEPERAGRPLLYTVVTIPLECRAWVADPKVWTRIRREIWKVLRKKFGGLYAVERSDPAGDSDPAKWHPHFNFLWVQRDGFRPFIDVGALRLEVARILGRTARNVFGEVEQTGPVDLHHSFTSNPKRIGFLYWYMGRTWPDWVRSVKKHLTMRWLGSYPKKPPPEKCCPDCGAGFVAVDCATREEALALAARGPEWVKWKAEGEEIERALRRAEREY